MERLRRPHPIKVALAQDGGTLRHLAGLIDCSEGTLSHIVNGRQTARVELAIQIAAALGRPVEELFPAGRTPK